MSRDDLYNLLQLVQGSDLSADEAFKEIEPTLYERDRLRADLEQSEARVRELEDYLREIRDVGGGEMSEEVVEGLADEALANSEKED